MFLIFFYAFVVVLYCLQDNYKSIRDKWNDIYRESANGQRQSAIVYARKIEVAPAANVYLDKGNGA